MAVRSTISAVVFKLPFSDRLPGVVKNVLDDKKASKSSAPAASTLAPPLSPKQKIHNRMMDRRSETGSLTQLGTSLVTQGSPISTILEEDETVRETESVSSKKTVMQQYLDEQNAKFDDLINKNLGEVLQQQKYQEEAGWRALVLNVAMARTATEVSTGVGQLVLRASKSVYSYYPFGEKQAVLEPPQEVVRNDQASFNALMESLDYNEKVVLMRRLHEELHIPYENDVSRLQAESFQSLREDAPLIDKVQMLMLLLIRLTFIGIKLFIPITTAIYTKFKNNDLLFVNSRNFDRFLLSMINMMGNMEERLDYDNAHPRENNDQATGEAAIEYLGGIQLPGNDSWAASIARYTISRYTTREGVVEDYTADPKYAQYFTRKRDHNDSDEENYMDAMEEYPSVYQVARQFTNEMAL